MLAANSNSAFASAAEKAERMEWARLRERLLSLIIMRETRRKAEQAKRLNDLLTRLSRQAQ